MKLLYCANCGTRLNILRKALPKFGLIVNVVEYHECLDEPIELDLKPIDIPIFKEVKDKNKFVQNLNDLSTSKSIIGEVDSNTLRDRRFENAKELKEPSKVSTPSEVLNLINSMKTGD
jgi:hypothetical protein